MSAPITPSHEHAALQAALRHDAERLPDLAFDPVLHAATMRKIRYLTGGKTARAGMAWRLALGSAAALGAILLLWPPSVPPLVPARSHGRVGPAPQASIGAYRTAAAQGDDVLVALLDRDAYTLLPPGPPAIP